MSDLSANELRRMNWYIKAMATGINYAVDDSIDGILRGKKLLEAAGWGKARVTTAGVAIYEKLWLNDNLTKADNLLYLRPPSTIKAYLKKQNMMLVANHLLSRSSRLDRQQAR